MNRDPVSDALVFAARKHAGQIRKTDPEVPYISHPAAVGFLLQEAGYPKRVIIAGILHDTLEDTDTESKEISDAFGKEVEEIVSAVSEDKSLTWEERKQKYLKSVLNGSDEAKAVATADKLDNIGGILTHLSRGDKSVWKAFSREPKKIADTYRNFVDQVGKIWQSPLLVLLTEAVTELESSI